MTIAWSCCAHPTCNNHIFARAANLFFLGWTLSGPRIDVFLALKVQQELFSPIAFDVVRQTGFQVVDQALARLGFRNAAKCASIESRRLQADL